MFGVFILFCSLILYFFFPRFDQKLLEDDSTNRMEESLVLFEEVCSFFPLSPPLDSLSHYLTHTFRSCRSATIDFSSTPRFVLLCLSSCLFLTLLSYDSIIIFFNKTDLFERKMHEGAQLGRFFPAYDGFLLPLSYLPLFSLLFLSRWSGHSQGQDVH